MDDEPIIWLRPEVSGRGKPPRYSRQQIARAAIEIADAEGLAAVSMRRVAKAIGAKPMSLYRYVRNRDELEMLMVDAVVDRPQVPRGSAPDDWRLALASLARGTRQLVLAHPWFVEAAASAPMGPNLARNFEAMLARLDGLGLSADEMLEILDIVRTFAGGYAQEESRETDVLRRRGLDREGVLRQSAPFIRSLLHSGEFPQFARIVVEAAAPHERDGEAAFERALDRILAGIAATLPPSAPDRR